MPERPYHLEPGGYYRRPWSGERGAGPSPQRFEILTFSEDYHSGLPSALLRELERCSVEPALHNRGRGTHEYRVLGCYVEGIQAMLRGGPPPWPPGGPLFADGPTLDQAMAGVAALAERLRGGRYVLEFEPGLLDRLPPGVLGELRRESESLELHLASGLARATFAGRGAAEDYRSVLLHYYQMGRPPARHTTRPRRPAGDLETMEAAALAEFGGRLPDINEEIEDHAYSYRATQNLCRILPL